MQFKAEQTGRANSVAGLCMTQMLYPTDMQYNRSSRQSHMNRWKLLTNSLASLKTLSFYFPLTCFFEDDENFVSLKQQFGGKSCYTSTIWHLGTLHLDIRGFYCPLGSISLLPDIGSFVLHSSVYDDVFLQQGCGNVGIKISDIAMTCDKTGVWGCTTDYKDRGVFLSLKSNFVNEWSVAANYKRFLLC